MPVFAVKPVRRLGSYIYVPLAGLEPATRSIEGSRSSIELQRLGAADRT